MIYKSVVLFSLSCSTYAILFLFFFVAVHGKSRGDEPKSDERKKSEDPLQKSRERKRTLREVKDVRQYTLQVY